MLSQLVVSGTTTGIEINPSESVNLQQVTVQDGTLSILEKVDILFKRDKSKVSVDPARPFQEETLNARPTVLYGQIWNEEIPTQAPVDLYTLDPDDPITFVDDIGVTLTNSYYGRTSAETEGTMVRRYYKLPLVHVEGSNDLAYYLPSNHTSIPSGVHVGVSSNLESDESPFQDVIPFNYDPQGTYDIQLYKNTGEQIPLGRTGGDWQINHEHATITFFNYEDDEFSGVDKDNPPYISFYRYVGGKGPADISVSGITGVGGGDCTNCIVDPNEQQYFNGGNHGTIGVSSTYCPDDNPAIYIDTNDCLTELAEGQCGMSLQFGPSDCCGSWRIVPVSNGDGTTSLHFQYRNNEGVWQSKLNIDPGVDCATDCT